MGEAAHLGNAAVIESDEHRITGEFGGSTKQLRNF